jgi:hypothetical protein
MALSLAENAAQLFEWAIGAQIASTSSISIVQGKDPVK